MGDSSNRREFIKGCAAAGATFMIAPSGILAAGNSPNEKLNIAIIGCGGRGRSNTGSFKGENIVALCDVNEIELEKSAKQYPKAKTYFDWRKCLEQEDIDAVVCSTIDHTHAFVANWALNRDLHVYCEKPLGNSVEEARVVRDTYLSKKGKIATQMGVQRHAIPNMARVAELIRDGAIGTPEEVRLWCGRKPEMRPYYPDAGAPPKHIHWDLWVGPSPMHAFNPAYVEPRKKGARCLTWNVFWDFGSGQIGDMGSHIMDIAWWALDLGSPTSCKCDGPEFNTDSVPNWIVAEWDHPANDWRPAVKVHWYDGGKQPGMPSKVFNGDSMGDGAVFKGDKGYLVANFGNRYIMPTKGDMTHYEPRKKEDVHPTVKSHHAEWIEACKTGKPTRTDFDYSGTMIEQNMLALVAYRFPGKTLDYDPKTMSATNCPEADQYIRKTYREGWVLNG
jgi:predicted dehydrogenase